MMTLNFETYLLASSPPGFELLSLRSYDRSSSEFSPEELSPTDEGCNGGCNGGSDLAQACFEKSGSKRNRHRSSMLEDNRVFTTRDKNVDKTRISTWETVYACDMEHCMCLQDLPWSDARTRKSKKVSFADDVGRDLTQVRVANEPFDMPPVLSPAVLEKLEQDLSGELIHDPEPESTCAPFQTPPLMLSLMNFQQPAADYSSFRERLDRLGVSLENIMTHDYCVAGTVKVKNLSYVKKVTLRRTFDAWKTFADEVTQQVIFGNTAYETFSFEFEVPSVRHAVLEFAVCYHAGGKEYWDNNEGKNYKVICINSEPQQPSADAAGPGEATLQRRNSLTEFSIWTQQDYTKDDSSPYW